MEESNKLLLGIKNAALVSKPDRGPMAESEMIYQSDNTDLIAQKILERFSIGDFIEISGTEATERFYEAFTPFPTWMELRIRHNGRLFVIFYPKGQLVWEKIGARKGNELRKREYKCTINEETLTYKIWRSK